MPYVIALTGIRELNSSVVAAEKRRADRAFSGVIVSCKRLVFNVCRFHG